MTEAPLRRGLLTYTSIDGIIGFMTSEHMYKVLREDRMPPPEWNTQYHRGDQRGATTSRSVLMTGPDYVMYKQADKISGVTKGGKSWSRWVDLSTVRVTTRARGAGPNRFNIYTIRKDRHSRGTRFANVTASLYTLTGAIPTSDEFYSEALDLFDRTFGAVDHPEILDNGYNGFRLGRAEHLMILAYPAMNQFDVGYGGWNSQQSLSTITLPLRERTVADFTRVAFGKTRYRKDLVKAVATSGLADLARVRPFAHLVPIDWIIELLRDLDGDDAPGRAVLSKEALDAAKYIMKRIPDSRKRTVFKSIFESNGYMLKDTAMLLDRAQRGAVDLDRLVRNNNVRAIHDAAVAAVGVQRGVGMNGRRAINQIGVVHEEFHVDYTGIAQEIYAPKVYEFKETEFSKKLVALELPDGMKFVIPKNSTELSEWGQYMGNCIASYDYQVDEGTTALAAIVDGSGKMIANLEFALHYSRDTASVNQFLGRFNATLDNALLVKVLYVLLKDGLVSSHGLANAWGISSGVIQALGLLTYDIKYVDNHIHIVDAPVDNLHRFVNIAAPVPFPPHQAPAGIEHGLY